MQKSGRSLFRFSSVPYTHFHVKKCRPTLVQGWKDAPGLRLIYEGVGGGDPRKWSREFYEGGSLEGGVKIKDLQT